jgi:hypothetical protein
MQDPDHLGKDEHGRKMTMHYKNRMREILDICEATTP